MQIKGKFYIWCNWASPVNHYWNQRGYWTDQPSDASFFNCEEDAVAERHRIAPRQAFGEPVVLQATRNL